MTQPDVASESSHKTGDLLKERNPFPNLRAGGRELSRPLESYRDIPDLIVLGIALAGLPVAHEVATRLHAPLDFVLVKRLLVPDGPGSDVCAISAAGALIIDEGIRVAADPSTPLEHYLAEAITELNRRERTCRRERAPLTLTGKEILLVDCGIRTGSTMKAAIRALRKVAPKQIIGAVPVASQKGHAMIANLCDDLICLSQPEQFVNAGFWYRDFGRPGDDEVGNLLV